MKEQKVESQRVLIYIIRRLYYFYLLKGRRELTLHVICTVTSLEIKMRNSTLRYECDETFSDE